MAQQERRFRLAIFVVTPLIAVTMVLTAISIILNGGSSDSVKTGEIGMLDTGSAGGVSVARTKEVFDRLVQLSVARDNTGYARVILSGAAYMVPRRTQVRVIDPGITVTEVRILEGDHYGESGFVPAEWVVK